jgi:hypothetical protein
MKKTLKAEYQLLATYEGTEWILSGKVAKKSKPL